MVQILQNVLVVPFRIDDSLALLLIAAAIIGCLLHLIKEKVFKRKIIHQNVIETERRYDIIQILIHWLFLTFLAALFLTGVILFKLDYFYSIYPWLSSIGLRSLFGFHWYFAILLIGLSIVHIIYDTVGLGKLKEFFLTRNDLSNFFTITRNFFGLTKDYPILVKLHPLQKVLHWGIILTLLLLGVTGLTIWSPFLVFVRSIGLGEYEEWLYIVNSRYLHDLFTFLFVGLMIGHFYFSVVVSSNRKTFKRMITGKIDSENKKKDVDKK